MKVLFDSNVIIDAITERSDSNAGAKRLYLKAVGKEIDAYLVSKQISDIAYVLRKYVEKERIKAFTVFLCKAFSILPFTGNDIIEACHIEGRDFEDDILTAVARKHNIECIVTANTKDFTVTDIEIYQPDRLLRVLDKE